MSRILPQTIIRGNDTYNTLLERKITRVMSNSFGFGGHNASIIAGKL